MSSEELYTLALGKPFIDSDTNKPALGTRSKLLDAEKIGLQFSYEGKDAVELE